jgi:hypothetical protein
MSIWSACRAEVTTGAAPRFECRVGLSITADEDSKDELTSALSKRLRGLGDVVIVGKAPEVEISIVAMETRSRSGQSLGYTVSTVVTEPYDPTMVLRAMRNLGADPKVVDLAKGMMSELSTVHKQLLNTCASDDLDEMCKRLVTTIDAGVIEGKRKIFQRAKDMIEEEAKAPQQ